MLTTQFDATIQKVTVQAKQKDGFVIRRCRVVLAREFDAVIAAGIGGEANKLRKSLTDRSISKVEIPIDAIKAECELISGDQVCTVKAVTGVRAVCAASTDSDNDESPPSVHLELEFPFQREAWLFLGERAAAYVSVTLTPSQKSLFDDDDGPLLSTGGTVQTGPAIAVSMPKPSRKPAAKRRRHFDVTGPDGEKIEIPTDDTDEDAGAERRARTLETVDTTPGEGGDF